MWTRASRLWFERLGEKLFEQEDLDVPVPEELHELVVLLPGLPDPQNVVEEQFARVRGRQALQTQSPAGGPRTFLRRPTSEPTWKPLMRGRSRMGVVREERV